MQFNKLVHFFGNSLSRKIDNSNLGMELFGIKFVPLNTPLEKRLQALAAPAITVITAILTFFGLYLMYHLILHTKYGIIAWLYLFWILIIDKDAELGRSRSEWVRSWRLWELGRDYYPVTLTKLPNAKFDSQRNYLLAAFPHGVVPNGGFIAFSTNVCDQKYVFPEHKLHVTALSQHFRIPLSRELYKALGLCGSSPKTINYLLTQNNGGNVVVLFVGGVNEALYARPGSYHVFLKQRKGFIRIALQNGSPLVPVFSFGENDSYTQLDNPEGSWLRNFQDFAKNKIGFGVIPVNGRGLFQYNFGFIPKQHPITILVGEPLEVKKVENPTQDEIDSLHLLFIQKLTELFEQNKHKYVENPEQAKLVII